jgi:hypothetical protein
MIRRLAITIASAIVAYAAWSGPELVGLAALMPALWLLSRNRWEAAAVAGIYYLVGSRCLPASAGGFFSFQESYAAGVAMWIGAAAANAAPWAAAWTASKDWRQIAARTAILIAVLTVPPLGWIGWLNPWLAASTLFPGGGWLSVTAGALILIVIAWLATHKPKVCVVLALTILVSQIALKDMAMATPPEQWTAIETQWGAFPHQATKAEFDRRVRIVTAADEAFAAGARVVVLPEQIAGLWSDRTELFVRSYLEKDIDAGKTLVVGATLNDTGHPFNAAMIISKDGTRAFLARQTVPVSMWHPWSAESYESSWLARGTDRIDGKLVAVSLCYEDFLFGLGLLSFLHDDPQVIVSIANGWWAANSNEVEVQRLHVASIARIFGVPLVRSINQP